MNNFSKDKILRLDDDSFKSLIMEINSLAGGDPKTAQRLAADIPSLKKQIDKMSNKDAEKLMSKIQSDKAEEILKKLNNI